MIDRLLALFATSAPKARPAHDIHLACAALLVEVMRADHALDERELNTLKDWLQDLFALDANEQQALLEKAQQQVQQANDLFQFTDVINQHWHAQDKFALLQGLWRVAYADAQLDQYEEHIIRRISDLLHIPHSEFIRAKLMAKSS